MALASAHQVASHHPVKAVTISVDGGPALHGAVLEVEGRTSRQRLAGAEEGDVVNIEAVIIAVDATVLSVFPLEGVVTTGDVVDLFNPATSTGERSHLSAVDVEVTVVPVVLRGDLGEEAHLTIVRHVDRDLHAGSAAGDTSVAALHAVHTFIRVVGRDLPRIGGSELPRILAEVTSLEVFDDLAHHAHAPVHLNIFIIAGDVRIVLGDNFTHRIEDLVHDEVSSGGLVVNHGARVVLDRDGGALIAILFSNTNVADVTHQTSGITGFSGDGVSTIGISDGLVFRDFTELVEAGESHGGAGDTGDTVLFVDVTADGTVAGDLNHQRIAECGFAFVVEGAHLHSVTRIHVVGQTFDFIAQVSARVVADRSVANQLTINIDVVLTEGTVVDVVPQEDGSLTNEQALVEQLKALRHVEVGREAPNLTFDFALAVALVNSPEVVGVVEQAKHGVVLGQVGGPVDQGLFAVVGATEAEAILGGVLTQTPAQVDAARHEAVGIVSRRGIVGQIRARHRNERVNLNDEARGIGRRSNQIVNTRNEGLHEDRSSVLGRIVVDIVVTRNNDVTAVSTAHEAGVRTVGSSRTAVSIGRHVISVIVVVGVAHSAGGAFGHKPTRIGRRPVAGAVLHGHEQVALTVPSEASVGDV